MRVLALAAVFLLSGCETISYYAQAINGHLNVIAAARPVDHWLADPGTSPQLRARLETAQRIRQFASEKLALPANASYASYADVQRPFVVYNVYAAAEFAVDAKRECFPFAGCVSYRGFFSEADARRHAEGLRKQGYDVHIGGVPAYSTLGWFDDPLLSTFIGYSDSQLARLVFHELAHQVVYAKDDTTFNESFAVVVEEEGVRRWLEAESRGPELATFRATQARKRELAQRVEAARQHLKRVYESSVADEEKRRIKREEFARLRAEFGTVVPAEPSNAFLVSVSVYTQLVPAFEQLLAESGSLEKFYQTVKELAAGEKPGAQLIGMSTTAR